MGSRQPERRIPHVQEVFRDGRSSPPPPPQQPSVVAERELKHIEKRMSMKKTIRKQISRQLAQAFIENPDLKQPQHGDQLDCNRNDRSSHNLTLTKCKMLATVDANFLDLLRRAEEMTPNIDPLLMADAAKKPCSNHFYQASAPFFKDSAATNFNNNNNNSVNKSKPSLWKRLWASTKHK